MKNKEVLIITNLIYPDSTDGSRYTYDLAKIFSENGYNVTLITSRFKKELKKEEIIDKIAVHRYFVIVGNPVITYLTNSVSSYFIIKKILKKTDPSLVIITGILPGFSYLLLKNSKHRLNVSICNTLLHSEKLTNQADKKWFQYKLFNHLKRIYESYVFSRVAKIIAISKNIENAILSDYPFAKEKVSVVEPGVDITTFIIGNKNNLRKKIYPNKTVFLFVGRFQPIKGPDIAINFAMEMKQKYDQNNFVLLMIGTGPMENELNMQIAQNNLNDVVKILGVKYNRDLVELYQRADYLILSSRSETFSLVILESLSCGTPIISTPTQGPKEIIGELTEQFIAKGFTGKELLDVAERMMNCDKIKYDELSKKGRCLVENKFSLDYMLKRLIEVIPL